MNSSWIPEVISIFQKEAKIEMRGKTGIATALVFSIATVATISLALYNQNLNNDSMRDVCSSLIWVVILFASLLTLPRTFLAEEEHRTGDLLRLVARPHAVFWGKALFNLVQMWGLVAIVATLFVLLNGISVHNYGLLIASLITGSAAIVGGVTLCGALASRASNRAAVAATIAIPLVLIPTQAGVSGLRIAFGSIIASGGQGAPWGLLLYAILSFSLGPWIYAAIWKT
jgi:heme exporter protein B